MKLSEHDKEVISCVFFRAELPVRQIASETGIGEAVVRRCLSRLLNDKSIQLRPFVNPFAVGLSEFMALISTHGMDPEVRRKLLNELVQSRHTTYVGSIGGDFHLAVMFLAQDIGKITTIFDAINERIGNAPYERDISPCSHIALFAPKYLGAKLYGPSSMTYGPVEKTHIIDELDQRLLHGLGMLTVFSTSDLARALGVPSSTVTYRLNALREKGIFLGFGYRHRPTNHGFLPFALQVKAAGISRAIRLKIREYCAAHQATSYLIEGAGAWDFQIGIRPTDMRAPTVIAEDILRTFAPHVTKVTTIPIHDCLKLVPYPLAEAWPMKRVRAAND